MLNHFRATFPFSRLGVRDHTGGPGGSLHTFSPVRKYDRIALLLGIATSGIRPPRNDRFFLT